ncbi:DUF1642 domain-containing protein, partial [Lactococcus lactis]|uniref:DUF1642 domain-containing protein n=1 Tax=Lactococcus lactis TaxID=1358 RepID=UPI0010121C82
MTKFEEEFKALTSWDWVNVDLIQKILTKFGNWHPDEEYQELFDKYSNLNDSYEKEVIRSSKLESQIIDLKSQLQQQALPVVPECVAEFITKIKKAHNSLRFAFNSKFNECPAEYWNEAIVWRLNNPDEFARAWLDGYQVEKPQLFKLIFPNSTAVLQKDGELNSFADTVYKRYLI